MYTLLFTFAAVFVFSDADSDEYHTDCSGLDKCFRLQAEIEKLEVEYFLEMHNNETFGKFCPTILDRKEESYACFEKMKDKCRINYVNSAIKNAKTIHSEVCLEYNIQMDITRKGQELRIKTADENCKEVVKCVQQLFETGNTGFNVFSRLVDKKYYKNLCANAEQIQSCFDKKNGSCELKSLETWIKIQDEQIQLYCKNDGPELFAKIWTVINMGCPRDKCYNDIRSIDYREIEKLKSSKNKTKKKEFCKIKGTFNRCEEKYAKLCEMNDKTQKLRTRSVLKELVCSRVEEADAGRANNEYSTNCSGLDTCFRLQAEIEKLELDYLLEVHNVDKILKFCPPLDPDRNEKSYACFKKMKDTCLIGYVNSAVEMAKKNHSDMCFEYSFIWDTTFGDTVTRMKDLDKNCTEVIQCVHKWFKKGNTGLSVFSRLVDKKYYTNLCANVANIKSCFAKKEGPCETKSAETWIKIQEEQIQLYCENDGPKLFDKIWSVIQNGCARDECYKGITKIDPKKLKKLISSKNLKKNKEFCKIRDKFNKCEEKYSTFCGTNDASVWHLTPYFIQDLVCSKEEEAGI